MSATSYRFVGEVPEVFPDLTGGRIQVAGAEHDPNAEDFQQPGELRPGQEFTGPEDLAHVRIERYEAGEWAPTIRAESPVSIESPPAPAQTPTLSPATGGQVTSDDDQGDEHGDGSEA